MTPGETIFWSVLTTAGLAGSALSSGFETGVYTIDRLRLEAASTGPRADAVSKRCAAELAHPARLLATILVSNNIANYLGTLGLAAIISGIGLSDLGVIVLNALVLTPVLLLFGEILPKEIFRVGSDRLTMRVASVYALFRVLLTVVGIVPALTWAGGIIGRLAGADAEEGLQGGRGRVATLMQEGVRAGVLSERQSGLIDRAMELRDTRVTDVMRPWRAGQALHQSWSTERARRFSAKQPRNRYAVVDAHGRPVGAVSAAVLWSTDRPTVGACMGSVGEVPADATARQALRELASQGSRAAIVTRGNAVLGVVSVRSLIEPLTGELGPLDV